MKIKLLHFTTVVLLILAFSGKANLSKTHRLKQVLTVPCINGKPQISQRMRHLALMKSIKLSSDCKSSNSKSHLVTTTPISFKNDNSDNREVNDNKYICTTSVCTKEAARLLDSLDMNVDPCNDFYQFACGGYLKDRKDFLSHVKNAVDDMDKKIKDIVSMAIGPNDSKWMKVIKSLYHSCMRLSSKDKASGEYLSRMIQYFGGWPAAEGVKWDEHKFDWIDVLVKMRKFGESPLIQFDVAGKYHDTINRLLVKPPKIDHFGLNQEDYLDLLVDAANYFGGRTKEVIRPELSAVLAMESHLKFNVKVEYEASDGDYALYTIKQLKQLAPEVDWLRLLSGIAARRLEEDEKVVAATSIIKRLSQLVTDTPKRTLANYIVGKFAADLLHLLPLDSVPRDRECVKITKEQRLLVAREYGNMADAKKNATEIAKSILKQLQTFLKESCILSENTKAKAIEKAKDMILSIGYPEEIINDDLLTKLLDKHFPTSENGSSFFENILKTRKFNFDLLFGTTIKKTERMPWEIFSRDTLEKSAEYVLDRNALNVYLPVLGGVYYVPGRPKYLDYGSLGAMIGSKMSLGFYDIGRKYDKVGEFRDWWDDETIMHYREKAECIKHQYDSFYDEHLNHTVNGTSTLEHNLADNAGVKEAYYAYSAWLSEHKNEDTLPGLPHDIRQLFWISFGVSSCTNFQGYMRRSMFHSKHTPNPFRVNGIIQNSKEFANDFKCIEGSPMNPVKRCEVC